MVWSDLLFLHWPVEPSRLRPAMPDALPLELRDGVAWLTVAAFVMSEVHPRSLPPFPGHARFPEINVRTYVTMDDRPGVYFFSLDVPRVLAVAGARSVFALNYFLARMAVRSEATWSTTRVTGASAILPAFARATVPAAPSARPRPARSSTG
jgi:uncharacterized protein YqjF (DUF2071 family)